MERDASVLRDGLERIMRQKDAEWSKKQDFKVLLAEAIDGADLRSPGLRDRVEEAQSKMGQEPPGYEAQQEIKAAALKETGKIIEAIARDFWGWEYEQAETGPETWTPLSNLSPIPGDPPPTRISMDDTILNQQEGNSRPKWYMLTVLLIKWLRKEEILKPADLPLRLSAHSRPIADQSPQNLLYPHKIDEDLYVETNFGSPNHVKNARRILLKFGIEPGRCRVTLPQNAGNQEQETRQPSLPMPRSKR